MAKGKNEILLSIALEGDQDVKSRLQQVGEAGKRSLADMEKKIGEVGKLERFKEPIGKAQEALAPFLEQAGLGGAFASLGEGGLLGSLLGGPGAAAAAVAGLSALAIHLAKVAEEAEATKKRLSSLGGGDHAFEGLQRSANELGVSPSTLQTGQEDFFAYRQEKLYSDPRVVYAPNYDPSKDRSVDNLPSVYNGGRLTQGPVASNETFSAAQRSLFEGASVDQKDSTKRQAGIDQLLRDVYANGELTADALKRFSKTSPTEANRVAKRAGEQVGQGLPNVDAFAAFFKNRAFNIPEGLTAEERRSYIARNAGNRAITPDQFIKSLAADEPAAKQAADAARGVSDAFEALKASTERLDSAFGESAGKQINKGLTDGLDKITGGVSKAGDLVERHKDAIEKGAEIGRELGSKVPLPLPTGATGALIGGVAGGAIGIGGDLAGQANELVKSSKVGDFLEKALTNPAAIEGNVPEQTGTSKLTPEALKATKIPSPLDGVSLFGSPASQPALPQIGQPVVPGQPPAVSPAAAPFVPDRTLDGWQIAPARPLPPPTPDQTQPVQPPQQFGQADQSFQTAGLATTIGDALRSILESVSAGANSLAPAPDNKVQGPVDGLGIRGEGQPSGPAAADASQSITAAGNSLAAALDGVTALIGSVQAKGAPASVQVASGGSVRRNMDGGGHVSGPGTSTSDSIPAMLSDREYVIKASSAQKIGRRTLDQLNAGNFANGGEVTRRLAMVKRFAAGGDSSDDSGVSRSVASQSSLGPGDHEITYDPTTGGAYVDGTLHVPGDPLLDDPTVRQGIAQSKAGMNQQPSKRKYKSDFVGRFGHSDDTDTYVAAGGPIGDWRGFAGGGAVGNLRESISRFAGGGSVSIAPMLHLADGGGADGLSGSPPTLGDLGPSGAESLHPVTLDFGSRQIKDLRASPSVLATLTREAGDAALAQTGDRPSWYQGK